MLEIILALIGLLFSIILAGAEIALLSASSIQIEVWQRKSVPRAARALNILRRPEGFLIALLIAINLAQVTTTSYATAFLEPYLTQKFFLFLVISLVVLIIGEILPKTIVRNFPNHMLLASATFLSILKTILSPLVWTLNFYLKLFRVEQATTSGALLLDQRELDMLFRPTGNPEEKLSEERQTIARILRFPNTTVGEIMVPRPQIIGIPEGSSLEDAEKIFLESGFSKLPLYKGTLDSVTGIVFLHDLFTNPASLKEIVRPAYFIPESKPARELLREFQERRISIAIVVDEYGGTAGLVTMEDLTEELFGEFTDVFDADASPVQVLKNGLLIKGMAEVDWLNETYGLNIPPGDYETLAGFFISRLGHIPRKNEQLFTSSHRLVVSSATATRVEKVFAEPRQS